MKWLTNNTRRLVASVQTELRREARFADVIVVSQGSALAIDGLVDSEQDAWDARNVAWKLIKDPHQVKAIFMAVKSKEPGMSRFGIPWAAVPSSADAWEAWKKLVQQ